MASFSRRPGAMIAASALLIGLVLTAAMAAEDYVRTAGGLTIYFGILPSAMTKGHPSSHEEATMHGGPGGSAHRFHILVAVFDAVTGKRVEDANVSATITGLGLAGTKKVLEPMRIADTTTYGNYYDLGGSSRFRIAVEVQQPSKTKPVTVEFAYQHSLR